MGKIQQREVLQYCIDNHLCFAIYRLPQQQTSTLIISNKAREISLNDIQENNLDGFVVAPFDIKSKPIVFIHNNYEVAEDMNADDFSELSHIAGQMFTGQSKVFLANLDSYAQQFNEIQKPIFKGEISKAILSRIKEEKELSIKDAVPFYYMLESVYPSAYVSMSYTPQSGLWAGASPELLLEVNNHEATTVSLAGTRKTDTNNWGDKEIDEQQIVTDFVGDTIRKFGISDYKKLGPDTINAGKMVHLKTSYQFKASSLHGKIASFIDSLHPTPAVCGLPQKQSKEFIVSIEKHDRSFYAGFMGRINNETMKLFVNIRCLQFHKNHSFLYLGGGITKDSNLDMEWKETELKAETMLSVIKKIRHL